MRKQMSCVWLTTCVVGLVAAMPQKDEETDNRGGLDRPSTSPTPEISECALNALIGDVFGSAGNPNCPPATGTGGSNPPPETGPGGYNPPPQTSTEGYNPPPKTGGEGYNPPPQTGGEGYNPPPQTGGEGYNPPPQTGGGYQPEPNTKDCECVPFYLCDDNNTIIEDGVGLLDIRIKDECGSYDQKCCGGTSVRPPENPVITPRPPTVNPTENRCGIRNFDGVGVRITGAEDNEAQYGEFPWMVAVVQADTSRSKDGKPVNVYQCGGSLIHPQVVLTGAHCVRGKNNLIVRAGEWDTQTKNELYPAQDINVREVIVHEQFNNNTLINDPALLILERPVDTTYENVGLICLPEENENMDGRDCVASGWGKDQFGKEGKYQVILKRIELPIVPRGPCLESLRKTRLGTHFKLHPSFICAGGRPGKDTCKGDGGSPLACPSKANPGVYVQAGIVAWGINCGTEAPGVYVNVPSFVSWIYNKLQQNGISLVGDRGHSNSSRTNEDNGGYNPSPNNNDGGYNPQPNNINNSGSSNLPSKNNNGDGTNPPHDNINNGGGSNLPPKHSNGDGSNPPHDNINNGDGGSNFPSKNNNGGGYNPPPGNSKNGGSSNLPSKNSNGDGTNPPHENINNGGGSNFPSKNNNGGGYNPPPGNSKNGGGSNLPSKNNNGGGYNPPPGNSKNGGGSNLPPKHSNGDGSNPPHDNINNGGSSNLPSKNNNGGGYNPPPDNSKNGGGSDLPPKANPSDGYNPTTENPNGANSKTCECVPFYLCDNNNTLAEDGVGLLDLRIKDECGSYDQKCCGGTDVRPPDNPAITPRPGNVTPALKRCGIRNSDGVGFRITGAEDNEAQYGEFPWMVAVVKADTSRSKDGKPVNVYQCGGSLIHPQVVLTGAHCVRGKDNLVIRAGEWDTQTENEPQPTQDRKVRDVIVHELFNNQSLFNDLALLILESPVDDNFDNVGLICLPEQNESMDGRDCVASGWGKDQFGKDGIYQVILKRVDMPIVPRGPCLESLRKTRLGTHFKLHPSFICAGGIPGKDTCKGDGGGPLVCPSKANPEVYVQAGIVAWGINCGTETPGVYVNVPSFVTWIYDKLQQHGIS